MMNYRKPYENIRKKEKKKRSWWLLVMHINMELKIELLPNLER
jgi:hypothetical protein